MATTHETQNRQGSGYWVMRSWISVALIPVFFFAAFVLAYGIYSLFGYTPDNMDAPFWVELIVAVVAVTLFLAPCVAAVVYGLRAARAHDRRGLVPVVIGGFVGAWMTIINVVSLVGFALD